MSRSIAGFSTGTFTTAGGARHNLDPADRRQSVSRLLHRPRFRRLLGSREWDEILAQRAARPDLARFGPTRRCTFRRALSSNHGSAHRIKGQLRRTRAERESGDAPLPLGKQCQVKPLLGKDLASPEALVGPRPRALSFFPRRWNHGWTYHLTRLQPVTARQI